MSFNPSAPDKGGKMNIDLVPEGPTAARCARVIEIGQQESKYGTQNRAVIAFSLPMYHVEINGEKKQRFMSNPFGINMTTNEGSTMYQYTKALNPQATSLGDFLNRSCQLVVAHYKKNDGNLGDRIDAIAPIMPGYEVPELDTEPFWFEWDNPTVDAWAMIPEFTRNLIREAKNYPGSKVEELDKDYESGRVSEKVVDDIPF